MADFIPHTPRETQEMLGFLGLTSLEELVRLTRNPSPPSIWSRRVSLRRMSRMPGSTSSRTREARGLLLRKTPSCRKEGGNFGLLRTGCPGSPPTGNGVSLVRTGAERQVLPLRCGSCFRRFPDKVGIHREDVHSGKRWTAPDRSGPSVSGRLRRGGKRDPADRMPDGKDGRHARGRSDIRRILSPCRERIWPGVS